MKCVKNHVNARRGLLCFAIASATLAVVPAAVAAEHASSVDTPEAGTVVLYNRGPISAKPDGTDDTVRLEAGAGPGVGAITFSFTEPGQDPVAIATVDAPNDNAAYAYEWQPAADGLNAGDVITLTATGELSTGGATTSSTEGVPVLSATDAAVRTVNLISRNGLGNYTTCGGGDVTGYDQAILSGTTSMPGGEVIVGPLDGTGTPAGSDVAVRVTPTSDRRNGTFTTTVSIDDFSGGRGGEVVIRAASGSAADDTRDYEAYTLYGQVPTTTIVRDEGTTIDGAPEVTITALDQNGAPIAGASVRRSGDDDYAGESDQYGEVTTLLDDVTSASFYVDINCDRTYTTGEPQSESITPARSTSVRIITTPASNPSSKAYVADITAIGPDGAPLVGETLQVTRAGSGTTYRRSEHVTRADGTAYYGFSCEPGGTVTLRAAVDDPEGAPGNFDVIATTTVTCRDGVTKTPLVLRLTGRSAGPDDVIRVRASDLASGAKASLFRVGRNGRSVRLGEPSVVDEYGDAQFRVRDSNRKRKTTYVVKVPRRLYTERASASFRQR